MQEFQEFLHTIFGITACGVVKVYVNEITAACSAGPRVLITLESQHVVWSGIIFQKLNS